MVKTTAACILLAAISCIFDIIYAHFCSCLKMVLAFVANNLIVVVCKFDNHVVTISNL